MKSKIWKIPYSKPVIPPELLAAGYTPLLAAVLNLRGITTADEAAQLIRPAAPLPPGRTPAGPHAHAGHGQGCCPGAEGR